jgi:sugar transferase (PEP-CTERM/EpsH1 system associated)
VTKEPLLFICHRIPFPPNKGDKIRSFNILKQLSATYDIHLASLIDDPHDWQYQQNLQHLCASLELKSLHPLLGKIKGVASFLRNRPISLPYFYNMSLHRWIKKTIAKQRIKKVFIYSSAMAQYVEANADLTRIADYVDVDSDKWRQYANQSRSVLSRFVFNWEARTLENYERKIARDFEGVAFVSNEEAEFFRKNVLRTQLQDKVFAFPNGVDLEYFSDQIGSRNPLQNSSYIVFTGAMDYKANVESVIWFCEHVWPLLAAEKPQLKLAIVGGNPNEEVKALTKLPGVIVTGRVEDIRPYIQYSELAIAPIQIARGIQNKVLEGMAMGKAMVMSSMAAEGIKLPKNQQAYVQDRPEKLLHGILHLLDAPELRAEIGGQNRQWMLQHYTWSQVTDILNERLKKSYA